MVSRQGRDRREARRLSLLVLPQYVVGVVRQDNKRSFENHAKKCIELAEEMGLFFFLSERGNGTWLHRPVDQGARNQWMGEETVVHVPDLTWLKTKRCA